MIYGNIFLSTASSRRNIHKNKLFSDAKTTSEKDIVTTRKYCMFSIILATLFHNLFHPHRLFQKII